MAVTLTNRSTVRTALYTLINSNVVGSGKGLSLLFKYQPDKNEIGGKSPIAWLSSGPTKRDPRTFGERTQVEMTFLLQTAVKVVDGGLTPSEVEDRLDLIEKELRELFRKNANRNTATWDDIRIEEESIPGYSTIGGAEYRIELFAVKIELKDN